MRQLILTITLCISIAVQAQLYCVDGIYYSVISETDRTVSVRCPNQVYHVNTIQDISKQLMSYPFMEWEGNAYSGDIVIPSSIVIPEFGEEEYTVTEIGEGAFYNCEHLTSVILPETIRELGPGAFANCISLTSMYLNDDITMIEGYAFSGCKNMHTLHYPLSCRCIHFNVMQECGCYDGDLQLSGLDNVLGIDDYGMIGCGIREFPYMPSLLGLSFEAATGTKCETIDLSYLEVGQIFYFSGVLASRNLKRVYLPTNCCSVEDPLKAFNGSKNLSYIQIYDSEPPVLKHDWAAEFAKECELVVPDESVEKYKAAPYWQNFHIIRGANTSVESVGDTAPKEVRYYDMNGCQIENPSQGIFVREEVFENGVTTSEKVIF